MDAQEDLGQYMAFRGIEPTGEDPDMEQGKYCTNCGQYKEWEKFHKDATKPDGYRNTCKACRLEISRQEKSEKRMAYAMAEMERRNTEVLEQMANHGGTFAPHLNEVFEALIQPFGGVHGLSKHIFAFYATVPPGSEKRLKILTKLLEMSKQVTELGLAERKLDQMDEQDLIAVMQKALTEYQTVNDLPSNAIPLVDGYMIDGERPEESEGTS